MTNITYTEHITGYGEKEYYVFDDNTAIMRINGGVADRVEEDDYEIRFCKGEFILFHLYKHK